MRNVFIQDLKNIKSEVLALKQSYIRGLDRINCYTAKATHLFSGHANRQYNFRLTIIYYSSTATGLYEPYTIINDYQITSYYASVYNSNSKTLIIAGSIVIPQAVVSDPYTIDIISTAPINAVSLEQYEAE